MSFVEIARFLDLEEAQVAAAALRSSGMIVLIQNEGAANANFALIYAMGGIRLLVHEGDAHVAQAFLDVARKRLPAAQDRPPTSGDLLLRALGAIVTLGTGVLTPLMGRRRERLPS